MERFHDINLTQDCRRHCEKVKEKENMQGEFCRKITAKNLNKITPNSIYMSLGKTLMYVYFLYLDFLSIDQEIKS